jgi:hypothetical protein
MPKRLRQILIILVAGIALMGIGLGVLEIEIHTAYAKAKVRVRHYFDLGQNAPLTNDSVRSALLAHFPLNTPVAKAQAWLAANGLGVDGQSGTWQENQTIYYRVEYYDLGSNDQLHVDLSIPYDQAGNILFINTSNVRDSL